MWIVIEESREDRTTWRREEREGLERERKELWRRDKDTDTGEEGTMSERDRVKEPVLDSIERGREERERGRQRVLRVRDREGEEMKVLEWIEIGWEVGPEIMGPGPVIVLS